MILNKWYQTKKIHMGEKCIILPISFTFLMKSGKNLLLFDFNNHSISSYRTNILKVLKCNMNKFPFN